MPVAHLRPSVKNAAREADAIERLGRINDLVTTGHYAEARDLAREYGMDNIVRMIERDYRKELS